MNDILRTTSLAVDQVTVEPEGSWSAPDDADLERNRGGTPDTDDDDDLVEIAEPGLVPVKMETLPSSFLLERTPAQSREASTPSSAARLSSKKRPAAQVIDLTGSDEEDESPAPPRKRPTSGFPHNPRGLPIAGSPSGHRPYGGHNFH